MTSIDHLKLLLDIELFEHSEDMILELYLSRARNFVLNECNLKELNSAQEELAEDIAVFKYRNKGIENVVSESKGSLSESYRDGLPSDLIQALNSHKRLKFV